MLLFQGLFALIMGAGVAAIGAALGGAGWVSVLLWLSGSAMGAILATILLSVRALLEEPLAPD